MTINSTLKRLAFAYLPTPVLDVVKRLHYARALRNFSTDEEPDLEVVQDLVRSGDLVLDVGANIGVYAKSLAGMVGKNGRVIAFEPVPSTYKILSYNVSRLRLGNVETVPRAVSDRETSFTMEIPAYDTGGENIYCARILDGQAESPRARHVTVHSTSLDSYLGADVGRVAFVKCDVEGHELSCVEGASHLLDASRPAWLIEVSGDPDDARSPSFTLFQRFSARGYEVWWYDRERLRPRRAGDRSTNYFFLTPAHLAMLGRLTG